MTGAPAALHNSPKNPLFGPDVYHKYTSETSFLLYDGYAFMYDIMYAR
jgi:hypothetical protein